MTLHAKQLVHTIHGMAKLLATSVEEDAIGPRGPVEDDEDDLLRDPITLVLDKLTLNLVEAPRSGATLDEVLSPLRESNLSYGLYVPRLWKH
jgi:hypothetical protein